MEQFIGFIVFVVYILFLIFSFLGKQKKKTAIQRQQQTQPPSKDLQTKMGDFFGELQKRFEQEQAQPTRQKSAQPKQPTRLVVAPAKTKPRPQTIEPEDWQEQDIFETTDVTLQASLETPIERLSVTETPTEQLLRAELATQRQRSQPPSVPSLLAFDKRYGYLRGILMAEILGPPVSKRHRNIGK